MLEQLFNVYLLYRKSWTFWVTDKELPIAGEEDTLTLPDLGGGDWGLEPIPRKVFSFHRDKISTRNFG